MAKIIRKQQAAPIAANGIINLEWSAGFIIQNIHRTQGIKVIFLELASSSSRFLLDCIFACSGFFKQNFAQVTNPAIDPIREETVMSLMSYLGERANLLNLGIDNKKRIMLEQPVLETLEFIVFTT